MHSAGEAVGRQPLRHGVRLDECAIDLLGLCRQDAVQANGVGHLLFLPSGGFDDERIASLYPSRRPERPERRGKRGRVAALHRDKQLTSDARCARLSGCSLRQKLKRSRYFRWAAPIGHGVRCSSSTSRSTSGRPQSLRASGAKPLLIPQGLTKPLAISPQPSTSQPSDRRSPRLTWAELGQALD